MLHMRMYQVPQIGALRETFDGATAVVVWLVLCRGGWSWTHEFFKGLPEIVSDCVPLVVLAFSIWVSMHYVIGRKFAAARLIPEPRQSVLIEPAPTEMQLLRRAEITRLTDSGVMFKDALQQTEHLKD